MKYTIKDLKEGKCAVINDGTVEELRKVLRLAFEENFGVVGWGRFYYKDHTRYACDNNTTLPTQSVKDFLINETTEYKGELKGFPKEIVDKMLDCQEAQGNRRNITVFENCNISISSRGGFDWYCTGEGHGFWNSVIHKRNFPAFFEKYPKMDKEYKGKAVHCETQEQWDFAAEKLGRKSSVVYRKYGDCININNPEQSDTVDYFTERDYQVLSFQEWLDENGYVFEDKINVLPKEWCIKVTSENKKMLVKWREGGGIGWLAENEAPKGYIFSKYKGLWEETNRDNTYEITTEQFKKHILHQETEEALRLEEIEFDKNHSWKDYKEGDYVVITEFEGKTDWNHWFMPGEVLKLGGEEWEGNIKDSFDACSLRYPDGNGMPRHFEENYKIRKATQEEIDNSQWGEDKPISVRKEGNVTVTEYAHQTIWKTNYIPLFTDQKPENVEIKLPELKVKLRNKRIKIKL